MSPEKTPLRDSELKSKALENQEDWDRPSIKNLALQELLGLGMYAAGFYRTRIRSGLV